MADRAGFEEEFKQNKVLLIEYPNEDNLGLLMALRERVEREGFLILLKQLDEFKQDWLSGKSYTRPTRITGKRLCEKRGYDPYSLAEMLRNGVRAWCADTWRLVVDAASCPIKGEFPEGAGSKELLRIIERAEGDPDFRALPEAEQEAELQRRIYTAENRGLIAAREREAMLDAALRRLGKEVTADFEARAFLRWIRQVKKPVAPSGCYAFQFYPPEKEEASEEWEKEIVSFAFSAVDVDTFEREQQAGGTPAEVEEALPAGKLEPTAGAEKVEKPQAGPSTALASAPKEKGEGRGRRTYTDAQALQAYCWAFPRPGESGKTHQEIARELWPSIPWDSNIKKRVSRAIERGRKKTPRHSRPPSDLNRR